MIEENNNNDDDCYQYPFLICSKCNHDMNHPAYHVFEHPELGTPLCILCNDDIIEMLNDMIIDEKDYDVCTWCKDTNGGTMYVCGDGNNCKHLFCEDCINNYPNSNLRENVDNNEIWTCLKCDNTLLKPYHDAIKLSNKNSWYPQNFNQISMENIDIDDTQITDIINLLKTFLEEEDDTIDRLKSKNRAKQYQEILQELKQQYNNNNDNNNTIDIKTLAAEELHVNTTQWQRHLDLIIRQITELEEILERNGYDSNSFIKDTMPEQGDNNIDEVDDDIMKIEMDINEIMKKSFKSSDNDDDYESSTSINDESENFDIDNYLKLQQRLGKLQKKASNDDNVQFFVDNPDKPDLDDNFFPSDFPNLVPKIVLKALYYLGVNSQKGKSLIMTYGITEYPHIPLIMKHIDKKNKIQWPSVKHLHPAVINVLRGSDRPADIELLGKHYDLKDFAEIHDMGDIQEVYRLYQTSGLDYKKKLRVDNLSGKDFDDEMEVRFSLSEVMDADEAERNSENLTQVQRHQIESRSCGENDDLRKHKDSLVSYKKSNKRKHSERSNSKDLNEKDDAQTIISKKSSTKKGETVDMIDDDDDDDDDNISEHKSKKSQYQKSSSTKKANVGKNESLPSASQSHVQGNKNKNSNDSINKSSRPTSKPLESEIIDLVDSDDDDDFVENNPPKKVHGLFKNSPINFEKSSSQINESISKNNALDRLLGSFDAKEALYKKVVELFPSQDPLLDDSEYLLLNQKRIKKGDEPIYLLRYLSDKMKQHQKEGLQFIWNNVIDEIDTNPNSKKKGSGCILAHCMGLGKTLTIIAFTITVLASPVLNNIKFNATPPSPTRSSKSEKKDSKDKKKQNEMGSYFSPVKSDHIDAPPRNYFFTILIIAPVNTLNNWIKEFNNWCPEVIYKTKKESYINVTLLAAEDNGMDSQKKMEMRLKKLRKWHTEGGVLIMGYDMFRLLTGEKSEEQTSSKAKNNANPKAFAEIKRYLLDPGPDIVICDEAHTIKEKKSKITELLCKIVTKRRIALTGSPLQNNLEEYYQMVNWVRPKFLGTLKSFKRMYIQVIAGGEHKEAGHKEVIAMRKRAYMLHKKLKPIVDRKDLTELEKTLLPKREFSVLIKMTEFQGFMYKTFLSRLVEANGGDNSKLIFTAFQALLRVWNHPSIAIINSVQRSNKLSKGNNKSKQTINMKLLEKEMEPQVDFYYNEGQELSQKLSDDILLIEANLAQQESSLKSTTEYVDLVDSDDDVSDGDCEEYNYNDVALETQIDDDIEEDDDASNMKSDEGSKVHQQEENNINDTSGDSETLMPMDISKDAAAAVDDEVKICDDNWWKLKGRTLDTPSFEHGEFIKLSNKLVIFLSLLASSINAGDKVLVFTQSVMTLELIECVLKSERWGDVVNIQSECSTCRFSQWKQNYHYMRIDGSTSDRQDIIDKFNKLSHIKLFMLSTKAGNMGINLQSANRVIIFDSSWNPAHDLQAIYRAYRYGQTKNVFVYRLLAAGTMEEKIYKKQINKQAMSARIIDAQMPDNHFTMEEKAELLKFSEYQSADFDKVKEALTREPRDQVLINIVETYESCLHSIDDQTALLEDKDELKLNETELKEADEELEKEERSLAREGREVDPDKEVNPREVNPVTTGNVTSNVEEEETPSTAPNDNHAAPPSINSTSSISAVEHVNNLVKLLPPTQQALYHAYRRSGLSISDSFDKVRELQL